VTNTPVGSIARDIADAIRRIIVHQQSASISAETRSVLENALGDISTLVEELELSSEELRSENDEYWSSRVEVERDLDRLRSLFDSAPFAYLVTTGVGVVVDANAEVGNLLGLPVDHIIGKPLAAMVPIDERRDFRQLMRRCASGAAVAPWTVALKRRDGEVVRCVATCSLNGESLRWTLQPPTMLDSTTMQSLMQDEHRAGLTDHVTVALYDALSVDSLIIRLLRVLVPDVCDFCLLQLPAEHGTMVRCGALHGDRSKHAYVEELMAGAAASAFDTFPAGVLLPFTDEVAAALATSERERAVFAHLDLQSCMRADMVTGDGDRSSAFGCIVFGWTGGGPDTAAERTALLEMTSRVARMLQRGVNQDANHRAVEATTTSLVGFAHDVRTPIAALIAQIELLEARDIAVRTPGAALPLHSMRYGASHLWDLATDIMRATGVESGTEPPDRAQVDAALALKSTALLLGPVSAERGIALELVLPAEPLPVHTDVSRLRRILINLLDRSIRRSSDGVISARAFAERDGVTFAISSCSREAAASPASSPPFPDSMLWNLAASIGGELHLDAPEDGGAGSSRLWIPA
jgi:PAS domain S-box-containing protein